ncbi:MAG TPA: MarR family transcriptional regulator, partial [Lachnospiraceae bacterium]|nr:MarR family transcriptional regulator [Lachnospiraceae bacterium]
MDKALDTINAQLVNIFDNVLRIEAASVTDKCGAKLSMTEVHTIAAIGTGDLKSMGEVAENLHITVGTLTVAINNLVKKGYAIRYKSEKDR